MLGRTLPSVLPFNHWGTWQPVRGRPRSPVGVWGSARGREPTRRGAAVPWRRGERASVGGWSTRPPHHQGPGMSLRSLRPAEAGQRAAHRVGDDAVVEGAERRAESRWAGGLWRRKLPPTPFTSSIVEVGLTVDLLPKHTKERVSRCWGGCQGISSSADGDCTYQGFNRFLRLVQPLYEGTRFKYSESCWNHGARQCGHGLSPPSVHRMTE